MAQATRPLSPHLGIYRWYLAMALSILHRVTGSGLAVGLLLLTWWLLALAGGPDSFATAQAFMDNFLGGGEAVGAASQGQKPPGEKKQADRQP